MRARYYDPQVGRFTSQDPAMDGPNWFAYCGNDPVNFFDGNGQQASPTDLASWWAKFTKLLVGWGIPLGPLLLPSVAAIVTTLITTLIKLGKLATEFVTLGNDLLVLSASEPWLAGAALGSYLAAGAVGIVALAEIYQAALLIYMITDEFAAEAFGNT